MSSLTSARRAAEEFARVVDGTQTDVADRYADLTDTVDYLRAQPVPAPRPEFVADLRSRLMAAADTALAPAEPRLAPVVPLHQPTRRRDRRIATAAAAFVIVGGTAGVAAAAENSLPGDALYPIKRGIESAQVSFNASDTAKGQDLVNQAGTRLDEIDGLLSHGDSSAEISHTLASYQRSAADGADLLFVAYQRDGNTDVLAKLRSTLSRQTSKLDELRSHAPASARPDFASASALLADLDQQARVLCGNCGPDDGSGSSDVASAPALESLLTQPAQAAAAAQQRSRIQQLADKANEIASQTPMPSHTTPGTTTTTITQGATRPGVTVPGVPSSGGSVTTGVTTVTNSVQDLLGSVSTTTGGVLAPVTDPVTTTLDGVTKLLLGP